MNQVSHRDGRNNLQATLSSSSASGASGAAETGVLPHHPIIALLLIELAGDL